LINTHKTRKMGIAETWQTHRSFNVGIGGIGGNGGI
jgi:hypothetical protein